MSAIERYQTLFILAAVIVGLLLGQYYLIAEKAVLFIVPFLMVMLYGVFLQISWKNLGDTFLSKKFTTVSLIINFIWNPFFAWGLGAVFLKDSPELWIGLIMLIVTPCTDWYLIFTALSRGNVFLAVAILPWNLILQLMLLPVYLMFLAGMLVEINYTILLKSILMMLAIPFISAFISRVLFVQLKGEAWLKKHILPKIAFGQSVFLFFAITAMFASQGNILFQNLELIVKLLIPLMLFFIINFFIAQLTGKAFNFKYNETTSLTFTTLARNSPVALAIAVSAFPDKPIIALALVIGSLIELPVLAIVSWILLKKRASLPHLRDETRIAFKNYDE